MRNKLVWPSMCELILTTLVIAAPSALLFLKEGKLTHHLYTKHVPSWVRKQHIAAVQQQLKANWAFKGVETCAAEGDRKLCPYCNSTFTKRYPLLASEHLQRSFLPGGPCSMPPGILERLQSGLPVRIVAIGGSMTAGHACFDGDRNGRACAWPQRMQERLLQMFPDHSNITVANMATPGQDYTAALSSGRIRNMIDADVLLVDLQVNSQIYTDPYKQMEEVDRFIHQVLSLSRQQQRHLGVLFVESFRTCSIHTEDCNKHCPARSQGNMLYNHTGQDAKYSFCNRWWTIASFERPVVQHYKLPIASYRDAVWPDISAPPRDLPCFWNGMSHPDSIGHAMMADVVAWGFLRAIGADVSMVHHPQPAVAASDKHSNTMRVAHDQQEDCSLQLQRPPTRFHQQAPAAQFCPAQDEPRAAGNSSSSSSRGTFMTAEKPDAFQPVLNTGCWRLFEDKPGKPGWICQQGPTSVASAAAAEHSVSAAATQLQQEQPAAASMSATKRRLLAGMANTTHTSGDLPGTDNMIVFKVHFSSSPQLQLTYLTSYTNMGTVEVALYAGSATGENGDTTTLQQPLATYTIDSAITQHFSTPRTSVFVHPAMWPQWQYQPHAQQLPAAVQQGEYVVALKVVAGNSVQKKFKLLALAAC